MRWFAMIATSVYVVVGIHGGWAYAAGTHEVGVVSSVVAAARARGSAKAPSWQMVAQQEGLPQTVNVQPEATAPEDLRYRPEGRRDPFESLVKEKPPVAELSRLLAEPGRPRGPLERYDVSALKLVGILWGELGRRALIRAPDNKGYFVTVGTYMGENGGQVINIHDDHLMIEEKFKDTEGNIVGKTLDLPLRRKEKQER